MAMEHIQEEMSEINREEALAFSERLSESIEGLDMVKAQAALTKLKTLLGQANQDLFVASEQGDSGVVQEAVAEISRLQPAIIRIEAVLSK